MRVFYNLRTYEIKNINDNNIFAYDVNETVKFSVINKYFVHKREKNNKIPFMKGHFSHVTLLPHI